MNFRTAGTQSLLAGLAVTAVAASTLMLSTPAVQAWAPVLSLAEDFSGNTLPDTLEESGPAPVFAGGVVTFPNDARRYLRTVANYDTTPFVAEVTVTINSGQGGGSGIVFFGLGAGEADGNFYGEPTVAPAAYARISPSDFYNFFALATSGGQPDYIEGLPGSGTHRVRINWDAATSTFTIAVHPHYAGGPFVSAQTFSEVLSEAYGPTNSRIFFGGAGDAVFDDLQIFALAGTPGAPNCNGTTVSSLANDMGGIADAAAAFGFPSVKALQLYIKSSCEG